MLARLIFVTFPFITLATPLFAAEPVRVVVSIAPIHSLVTSVMAGVAKPELLVRGVSPHTFMLKPSQMRMLHQADLIVWTGASVESFLPKVLGGLRDSTAVVELLAQTTVAGLATRQGGRWSMHDHNHHHNESRGIDGHIWLDPQNAKAITQVVVERLAVIDPFNEERYRENGQRLVERLAQLDERINDDLKTIKQQPFVVFHDAYHYLENRYDLNAVGALSVDPERRLSAKRLRDIRRLIERQEVVCLFREPQFATAVVNSVTERLAVKVAELDPMGSGLVIGPEMYFELMERMAANLYRCLNSDGQ